MHGLLRVRAAYFYVHLRILFALCFKTLGDSAGPLTDQLLQSWFDVKMMLFKVKINQPPWIMSGVYCNL